MHKRDKALQILVNIVVPEQPEAHSLRAMVARSQHPAGTGIGV